VAHLQYWVWRVGMGYRFGLGGLGKVSQINFKLHSHQNTQQLLYMNLLYNIY